MFLCEFCNQTSQPGEARRLVAVETRTRSYPPGADGKERFGKEVVIEAAQCPRCAGVAAPAVEAAA